MSDPPAGDGRAAAGEDWTPAEAAQLALLLEVAATPTPGSVDRERDLGDLHFEQFLAGAVGARPGLAAAADGGGVGPAFERAVAGMARQRGGNTQFGCLLLVVPLVAASARAELSPAGVTGVVEATTVEDAAAFYRAFDHVDVAVPPAEDRPAPDVRRGGDAVPEVEARDLALYDLMELSADRDDNAREWAGGFERTFRAADAMLDDDGPATDRAARAFLALLAERPDTLVRTRHGDATAERVRERAAACEGPADAAALAAELVAEGINPGTTADITAAAAYVALQRGLPV